MNHHYHSLNIHHELRKIDFLLTIRFNRQAANSSGYLLEYTIISLYNKMLLEANPKQREIINEISQSYLEKHQYISHLSGGELVGLFTRPNKKYSANGYKGTLFDLMPTIFKKKIAGIQYINFSKILSIRNKSVHPRKQIRGNGVSHKEALELRNELKRLLACFDFIDFQPVKAKTTPRAVLHSSILIILGAGLFFSGQYTNKQLLSPVETAAQKTGSLSITDCKSAKCTSFRYYRL